MMTTINPNWDLDYDAWADQYKPFVNTSDTATAPTECTATSTLNYGYETYGEDLEVVLARSETHPNTVWTIIEEEGIQYIVAGYRLVNRLSYLITEVPYEGCLTKVEPVVYWVSPEVEAVELIQEQ